MLKWAAGCTLAVLCFVAWRANVSTLPIEAMLLAWILLILDSLRPIPTGLGMLYQHIQRTVYGSLAEANTYAGLAVCLGLMIVTALL